MVTLDSDDVETEFTKIITATEKTIEYAKGKVIILTATLPRTLSCKVTQHRGYPEVLNKLVYTFGLVVCVLSQLQ